MATEKEKEQSQGEETPEGALVATDAGDVTAEAAEEEDDVAFEGATPANLGTAKYVQAAFFAAGVLVAYLSGNVLAAIWNNLADWPAAARAVPFLLEYAEDERPTFTMSIGALVGIAFVVYYARKADVRQWADEVATELYKVHWPERNVVTNGTIVVIVAGLFATVYVGLLDRVWGFVTNLVYGV